MITFLAKIDVKEIGINSALRRDTPWGLKVEEKMVQLKKQGRQQSSRLNLIKKNLSSEKFSDKKLKVLNSPNFL